LESLKPLSRRDRRKRFHVQALRKEQYRTESKQDRSNWYASLSGTDQIGPQGLTVDRLCFSLQRCVRKIKDRPPVLRYLFYRRNFIKYFSIRISDLTCHHVGCDCILEIDGSHPATSLVRFRTLIKDVNLSFNDMLNAIVSNVRFINGVLSSCVQSPLVVPAEMDSRCVEGECISEFKHRVNLNSLKSYRGMLFFEALGLIYLQTEILGRIYMFAALRDSDSLDIPQFYYDKQSLTLTQKVNQRQRMRYLERFPLYRHPPRV